MLLKHWFAGIGIAIALLLGLSTSVSAALVSNLGTISVPGATNDGNLPPVGAFDDDYTFQVGNDANLEVKVSILNASGFFINPASVTVSLFDDDAVSLLDSVVGVGTEILLSHAGLMPSTNYRINVTGTAGGIGGNYTVLLSVSAVPLPAAIWLFLSALVGLVSFARIRRGGTPT